jgi:glucose-1-phosphate thymidylyltransferase
MTRKRPTGLVTVGSTGGEAPPLLPVANRAILLHALETLRAAGVERVVVAVVPAGREAVEETIGGARDLGLEIAYVEAPEPLGPLVSLRAARPFLEDSVCVVHGGDGLVRSEIAPLVEEVDRGGADALFLVYRNGTRPVPLGDERLLRLLESDRRGLAVGGLQVFAAGFLQGPCEGASNLADAVELLVRDGGRARPVEAEDGWVPVRDADELLAANRMVLDELERGPVPGTSSDSRVQGRVAVHPSARLEATVVRGPCVIGAGALLRDAYIGPYTSIGDGVRVEGSEIEHSVVQAGAVIEHLGGRLEASVVGRGARIYRDFELPRGFRLRIGDGNEIVLR